MNRLMAYGVRRLFSGARLGRPGMAAFGAAVGLVGWLRSRGDDDELIYRHVLEEGETLRIHLRRGSAIVEETEVEG